ncbi:hypothetical protein GF318_05955 [Candidatus Micrarchaeota archaeon]|nr:hypothetical protein [Candidatus Micrarchaeota archaeon]
MARGRRVRRAPSVVRVPTLTLSEVGARAGRAFQASVNAIIREHFSRRPPASEISELRNYLKNSVSSRGIVDMDALMNRFSRKHPDFLISRYYWAARTTGWILSVDSPVRFDAETFDRLGRRIVFRARALQEDVREVFQPMARRFMSAAVRAYANQAPVRFDIGRIGRWFPEFGNELARHLAERLGQARSSLPMTAEYDSRNNRITVVYRKKDRSESS